MRSVTGDQAGQSGGLPLESSATTVRSSEPSARTVRTDETQFARTKASRAPSGDHDGIKSSIGLPKFVAGASVTRRDSPVASS
jgi:hypothetical protein